MVSKKTIALSFFCLIILIALHSSATAASSTPESLINLLKDQVKILEQKIEALKNTSSTPSAAFTKTLSLGCKDKEVELLQNLLAEYPEIYPEGIATGFFGPLTEQAVIKFQKTYGLEQVGIVGPLTRNKLNELLNNKNQKQNPHQGSSPTTNTTTTRTIFSTSSLGIAAVETKTITVNTTSTLIGSTISVGEISTPEDSEIVLSSTTIATSALAKYTTNQVFVGVSDVQNVFRDTIHLSNASSESRNIFITTKENLVLVLWQETLNNKTDIFLSRSEDYGKTFNTPQNLSLSSGLFIDSVSNPTAVIAQDGTVLITWEKTTYRSEEEIKDQEIYLISSYDQGKTFTAPKNISQSPLIAKNPVLKILPNGILIATWIEHPIDYSSTWYENGKYYFGPTGGPHLMISRSSDSGRSFTLPKRITDDLALNTYSVATDNIGKIYIAYQTDALNITDRTVNYDIFFMSSINQESFFAPINITSNAELSGNPKIITDSLRNIYIFYEASPKTTPQFEIYMTKSNDIGKSFTAPINISNTKTGHSLLRSEVGAVIINAKNDNMQVAWMEIDPPESTSASLYRSHSESYGIDWSKGEAINKKSFKYFESALDTTAQNTLILGVVSKEKPELK